MTDQHPADEAAARDGGGDAAATDDPAATAAPAGEGVADDGVAGDGVAGDGMAGVVPADPPPDPPPPTPGRGIITVSRVGTAVFTVTATAAVVDRDAFGLVNVVVSLALFGVGCVVFLWAFGIAVSRSRTDAIGIGGLYFLQGTAPRRVQAALMVPLAVQVTVALVAAGLRPFTSLAFGVLVPMFGLGQAGLWGARYGRFGSRLAPEGSDRPAPPH